MTAAMSTELWLACIGYLVWLLAGTADFLCHWRTDLPHTSGVAESTTHLVELALLGAAVVVWLVFDITALTVMLMFALVIAHAVVGYIDTRIAFARRRVILPVEQHVHSVLDMAPIVALVWVVVSTWPAAIDGDWELRLRAPALPFAAWAVALLPPVVLCIVPAVGEFSVAWRTRRFVASDRVR